FQNLWLVPSKPDLAGAAVELARRDDGERFLAESLGSSANGYSVVFLDCPPSLGPLTVNDLAAADRVLVPVQAEYYALEGLSQLLRSVDIIKARLNPRLGIAGVLLTMVDARTRLSADVDAELRRHLGRCGGLLEGGDGACRAFLVGEASDVVSRFSWEVLPAATSSRSRSTRSIP